MKIIFRSLFVDIMGRIDILQKIIFNNIKKKIIKYYSYN